jgi:hypothetical protein
VLKRFAIPALLKSQNAKRKPAIRMVRVRPQDGPIMVLGLMQVSPLMNIQRLLKEQFGVFG